jgi:REP element-mobilizing transposase RayT
MSASERRLPSPPYNPGVRDLVAGKRAWDARASLASQKQGFRGWHERGYLPHRDSPGLTQFMTYHLADGFPAELRAEWAALLKIEKERERRKELEAYLDKGRGQCWLRRPRLAKVCEAGFLHFNGQRYALKAWCVMPNHVHVLVDVTTVPMSEFVKSWKGFTARECNAILGRNGGFWADDYWDTYMRDADQERRAVQYIENNPVKAGLVRAQRLALEQRTVPERGRRVAGSVTGRKVLNGARTFLSAATPEPRPVRVRESTGQRMLLRTGVSGRRLGRHARVRWSVIHSRHGPH